MHVVIVVQIWCDLGINESSNGCKVFTDSLQTQTPSAQVMLKLRRFSAGV
jgi:hypothetical protein